jgi:hypothetical protein
METMMTSYLHDINQLDAEQREDYQRLENAQLHACISEAMEASPFDDAYHSLMTEINEEEYKRGFEEAMREKDAEIERLKRSIELNLHSVWQSLNTMRDSNATERVAGALEDLDALVRLLGGK